MQFRFVLRSLGLVALLAPLTIVAASCSGSTNNSVPPGDGEGGAIDPGTSPEGGATPDGAGGVDGAKPPPGGCTIPEITGVADVVPTFVIYEPPGTAPPAMTGGSLSGKYKVDKAKVYLPTMTKGLADPTKSTGKVNAWAAFSGTTYRIYLKSTFTISTVIGPQSQNADVESQGT